MTSSLRYLVGQTLTWMPTATFKAQYSLMAPDGATLATLDMSNWTSKANARVPEGTLFLHKEGWTGLKVAIYASEQGPLIATYQRSWINTTHGQLELANGRQFTWRKINFWGTQKAWLDSADNVTYAQFSTSGFSRKTNVIIQQQGTELPELSLLLVLGLYNILIERRDAAAHAAHASS
jgi:hypothetical protein